MPDQSSVRDAWTSTLTTAGPAAEMIADLTWIMVGVFSGVFVVVMLLMLVGIVIRRKHPRPSAPFGDRAFVVIGGVVLPAFILLALLVRSLLVTDALRAPSDALTIRVTGHMWWWDVQYPEAGIRLANEIYIPVNTPVRIELDSADVIHSFWVPSLSGKTDLLPGIRNEHWLQASRPGTYWGQCAEFCGLQHAGMSLYVVALEKEKYDEWVRARQQVALPPSDPKLRLGQRTFARVGCATCHAIRGTPADGRAGPDLTHMGSRLTIGAGRVPNNFGNLAGWIANPQAIKPGNKMPATYLEPDQLHALTAYLQSLK